MDDKTVVHSGGCHCKKIRWRARAPTSVVAWKCNCSMCSMRGNINFNVTTDDFHLLEDSKEHITTYTFGTHTAKHTFCKVCGITSFYISRTNPNDVSIVVQCIDAGTLQHVEIKHFDGQDWERSYKFHHSWMM